MRSKMLSFREMVNKKKDEWKKKYDSHLKWMDEYRESRGIVFLEEERLQILEVLGECNKKI